MGLIFGLLAVVWWELRKGGPMREPYAEGDPGDEDPEMEVVFSPTFAWSDTGEVQWAMCPRGHADAHLRPRDRAILCLTCSELYLARDFAEEYSLDKVA